MADTIVDFGGNAKITAAAWAKDKTLQDILTGNNARNQLLKLLAQSAKVEKDEIAKALGDVADKVTQAGESDAKGDHDKTQALQDNTAEIWKYQQKLGNITRTIAGVANTADTKSAFGLVNGLLDSLGNKLGQINPQFALVFGALSSIVSVASSFYHRLEELNKSTKDLYSTGLVFNGGMRGIVAAASDAGMSVGDLSKILTKFSAVGVTVGINRLTKLNSMFLQQTNLGANLMMSQEEASEALLETMEMMRSSGRLVGMTDEQVVKSGTDMLKSFNSLAEETGRNRDEIRKATNDLIKRPDIDTVLRSLDAESSKKLNETFTQVAAKMGQAAGPVADAIAKINLGGLGAVDENMRTAMNVIPGLTSAFEDAAKGVPGAVDRMVNIMDSPDTRQRMRALSVQLPDVAKTLQELSAGSRQAAEAQARLNAMSPAERAAHDAALKEQQRQQAVQNSVNASFKRFGNAFDKLALGFSNTLLPVVDTLATVFEYLGKALGGVGSLADMGGGTGGIVMSAVAVLGSGIFIAGSLRFLRKLVSGGPFKSLLGGLMKPGALPGLGGAGGGAAGDAAGKAGGGLLGGLGKGLGAVGEGLKGLGAGVGKAIEEILKGAAAGLGALSKPRLLIGVGVLGALAGAAWIAGKAFQEFEKVSWESMGKAAVAIVGLGVAAAAAGIGPVPGFIFLGASALAYAIGVIGVAIAGASWIMGKALPTLSEGLDSFAKIDGKNLRDVGLGLIELGAGLAALGAGSVVGAIGSFVGGFLTKITGDPADNIKNLMKMFREVAEGKDDIAAGGQVIEQIGKLNIAKTLGETISTLTSSFSSHWFSKDLGDVDEGYVKKFFNIFRVIDKASSGVTAGIYVLDQVSKMQISSKITDNISALSDVFSKHLFSKDIGDINDDMIKQFFTKLSIFGQWKTAITPAAEVFNLISDMNIGPGFVESIQTLGKMFSESTWHTTAADIDEKVLNKFFNIFDILKQNKKRIEEGASALSIFHQIGVTKADAEGIDAIANMFSHFRTKKDLNDVNLDYINKLGSIFEILGDNTQSFINGAGALAAIGAIDLSEGKIKGISSLGELFTAGWWSGLNKADVSLVDKLADIFNRFSVGGNDKKFESGANVLYFLSTLEFTEEKMKGIASIGSMFSQGAMEKVWNYLTKSGGANTAAIDALAMIFAEFGINTNSFIQGAGAFAALNTINVDGTKLINLFDLVGNKLFPKDIDITGTLGRVDGMMSIFDRFARHEETIVKAVNAITMLGTLDGTSLDSLQNLFTNDSFGGGAGVALAAPPTAATSNLDKATSDYYEKTVMQFNRMIELLELAHADANDLKKIEIDGLKDVADAIEYAGRIF